MSQLCLQTEGSEGLTLCDLQTHVSIPTGNDLTQPQGSTNRTEIFHGFQFRSVTILKSYPPGEVPIRAAVNIDPVVWFLRELDIDKGALVVFFRDWFKDWFKETSPGNPIFDGKTVVSLDLKASFRAQVGQLDFPIYRLISAQANTTKARQSDIIRSFCDPIRWYSRSTVHINTSIFV